MIKAETPSKYLWLRPTGNWSPALLVLDLDLVLVLPPLPRPDFVVISGIYLFSLYYIHKTPLYYYLLLAGGADAVGTGGGDRDKLLALCRKLLEEQHGRGSAGEIIENFSDAGKDCKSWGRLVFFKLVKPHEARHPTVLHITNVKNQ